MMMKLIDKYIFREWCKTFLLSFGSIIMILMLAIIYDDLRHLLEKQASKIDILSYFLTLIPAFLPMILPISILISLLFLLGQLHQNGEIIAMRASGLNYWSITRSLWLASITLTIILFILSTQFIPWSIQKSQEIWNKIDFQHEEKNQNPERIGVIKQVSFDNSKEGRLWFIQTFSQYTQTAHEINVYERIGNKETLRVSAKEGHFNPTLNAWVMKDSKEILFNTSGEPIQERNFTEKIYPEMTEKPELMVLLAKKPRHLSFQQVRTIVNALSYKHNQSVAKYAVKYYSMLITPLTCLIVTAIAIPFAIGSVRTNPLVGVSKAIGLFFLYYLISNLCSILGNQLIIPPLLAAFIPAAVMILLASILYKKMILS